MALEIELFPLVNLFSKVPWFGTRIHILLNSREKGRSLVQLPPSLRQDWKKVVFSDFLKLSYHRLVSCAYDKEYKSKGIFQEPCQKLLCEASPGEIKTMTHLLEIDNQLQNKIMSLLKTKFINQWVYRGCLQGHEWEVHYRSKDSSEAATSLKSTSTWLTIMETASLELTVCPAGNFVGLRASFRQFR